MKRTITAICALLAVLTIAAQTDFRHLTYEEGLAAAKSEQKLLFLDFYTDWCGPCKMMANNVFSQEEVGNYFNTRFVCLKLNAENEGATLARQLQVKAYPTFVVMDADAQVLGTKVGGNFNGRAFTEEIDRLIDPEKRPERLQQRYDAGERTADLIAAYAAYLTDKARENHRFDTARLQLVKQMVADYFHQLTDSARLASDNLFIYTSYTEHPDEPQALYMIAHRDQFAEPDRQQILEIINQLYVRQLTDYLSGALLDESYQRLKQGLEQIGKSAEYALCFRLIDCRAQEGPEALLALCESEYPHMDSETRTQLVIHLSQLLSTTDSGLLQRASRFLRAQLPDMELDLMYWAFSQLQQLENPAH